MLLKRVLRDCGVATTVKTSETLTNRWDIILATNSSSGGCLCIEIVIPSPQKSDFGEAWISKPGSSVLFFRTVERPFDIEPVNGSYGRALINVSRT